MTASTSPLDLQFRWAKLLIDANQADPGGLVAKAKALVANGRPEPGSAAVAKPMG